MKIKAYAVCGTTRKGNVYIIEGVQGVYAIFERKKDAAEFLKLQGEHIEIITLEVGE